jgi:hypothetical protein
MLLYHGCASYRQASKEGLVYDPQRTNDFGEGEYLQSCGGTYLSDSIEVAAFYAVNATNSEAFMGDDPCVFAVEVDDELLLADEDKVWDVMRVAVERALGRRLWDETDAVEAQERIDGLLARHGTSIEEKVADKFRLRGDDRNAVLPAVRAFLLRATCYEWSVLQPGFEAELAAINEFCALASGTISHGWFREHYDTFAVTCRTLSPILPMGSDGPARIVGSIRLVMGHLGLSVQAIEYEGEFSEEDALDFEESYIEKAQERAGCEIEPCEASSIGPIAA